MSAETLLADMRRKYLHAKAVEELQHIPPSWLTGNAIASTILEQWIPEVEDLAKEINRLHGMSPGSRMRKERKTLTKALTRIYDLATIDTGNLSGLLDSIALIARESLGTHR